MEDFAVLRGQQEGYEVYWAGRPHYLRNFTRDAIVAGLLAEEAHVLQSQLVYAAAHQGQTSDPRTGEEPGKIFHERPGVELREGLWTDFNGSDTTALWLMGLKKYEELTSDQAFKRSYQDNIERAVEYVVTHIVDGWWLEDPAKAGAERFSLRVTYWKDSVLAQREGGEPQYPVMYSLAHVMNLTALRTARALLDTKSLDGVINELSAKLATLVDSPKPVVAFDQLGSICVASSDWLHALFYLEPGDLSEKQLGFIQGMASELETPIGYQSLGAEAASGLSDSYHGNAVWVYEQAVVHAGAQKFGLKEVAQVSARIVDVLDSEPELFVPGEGGGWRKSGCDPQLWSVAAKHYFERALSKMS